ncbi:MAG: ADP-ribosylglycohydrolase family protein [Victivallaceae bacterium]|jgi:ADP-ribosylglycohydrolase
MKTEMKDYRKKVLGCWLGKAAGGTLGMPFEGYPGTHNLTYYDPIPTEAVPNDDLELQVMYACALQNMEDPQVSSKTFGDIWLKHMEYNADEYAVALCNIRNDIRPPWSGNYDNYFIDGMGAAIRSELWACLAPGNPELAAKYAYEDACVDHAENGIYAEVFFAALESQAFVETNILRLIDAGLSCIPEDCLIHKGVTNTCFWWRQSENWRIVRDKIFATYASEFATCVNVNVPFTILGLLAGGGDFGKSVCTAANCGMDTDCTAATAGAILGLISPDSIGEKWLKPIGRDLIVRESKIVNLKTPKTLDDFANLVIALKDKLGVFIPSAPAPEPDWSKHTIHAEICALKTRSWWHIPLRNFKGRWEPIELPGLLTKLDLTRYQGALQLLLKLKFKIDVEDDYSIMFNTPSSCQVYLDPDWESESLEDSRDMLFGRSRPFFGEEPDRFPVKQSMFNVVFSPCLGGAPLNQIKRSLRIKPGIHELLVSIVPQADDKKLKWCMGIGKMSTLGFLPKAFR